MKKYQRAIRIAGKLKKSPKFDRKSDADRWYNEQLRNKQFFKEGLHLPVDETTTLRAYFYNKWLPTRKLNYGEATWGSDVQRFRDYVESELGGFKVSKINTLQLKTCLDLVTHRHGMSINTRTHVRAMLSKLFGDAMNENPPLRTFNPALNITFNDARSGKKKPVFIKKESDVELFLSTAEEIGPMHGAYAGTMLMAAPRKSEAAGFKWLDFDPEEKTLTVSRRYVQAEDRIVEGTKAGTDETRVINIPDALVQILLEWREVSDFPLDDDFIFYRYKSKTNRRKYMSNRHLSYLHDEIRDASGVDVPPHALRHTYGRNFVRKTGNKKALQQLLGHQSSTTTDIYSDLDADSTRDYRNTNSYGDKKKKKS